MALAPVWYGNGVRNVASGNVDWDTHTIKMLLTTASYTPSQDNHSYRSDVTNEVSGAGYTAGGAVLSCSAPTYDTATNETRLDCADVAWVNATFSCRYAVVYRSRGGASSADELICYIDLGAQAPSAQTLTVIVAPTGLLKITAS